MWRCLWGLTNEGVYKYTSILFFSWQYRLKYTRSIPLSCSLAVHILVFWLSDFMMTFHFTFILISKLKKCSLTYWLSDILIYDILNNFYSDTKVEKLHSDILTHYFLTSCWHSEQQLKMLALLRTIPRRTSELDRAAYGQAKKFTPFGPGFPEYASYVTPWWRPLFSMCYVRIRILSPNLMHSWTATAFVFMSMLKSRCL